MINMIIVCDCLRKNTRSIGRVRVVNSTSSLEVTRNTYNQGNNSKIPPTLSCHNTSNNKTKHDFSSLVVIIMIMVLMMMVVVGVGVRVRVRVTS